MSNINIDFPLFYKINDDNIKDKYLQNNINEISLD